MTVTNVPPARGQKLPVLETAGEIYRALGRHIGKLPRAALWPFLLSLPLLAFELSLPENSLWLMPLWLVSGAIYTLFAVAWHRWILLEEEPSTGPASWSPAHNAFFGYFVLFFLLPFFLLGLPIMAMGLTAPGAPPDRPMLAMVGLILFPAVIIYWVLIVRWSFVFPARAAGERYGIGDSWRHTKGNFWRLIAVYLLVYAPFTFLFIIIVLPLVGTLWVTTAGGPTGDVEVHLMEPSFGALALGAVVYSIFYFVSLALGVTALSICFRKASGWLPPAASIPTSVVRT